MRCSVCNVRLSDYEATLKHAEHGHFLDTCLKCLDGLGIPVKGRDDLSRHDSEDDSLATDWLNANGFEKPDLFD